MWQVGSTGANLSLCPLLPIQVAKISPQLEALRRRAKALSQDIALAENSFTMVKSEKDLQGLQGLLSCQQEMEVSQGSTPREVSRLAGTFLVRHWPPSGGPGVVSLGTLWQGGLEFSSGAEICLLCSSLIAWARQGDRTCISSHVPTPSCQHLTCLPTGGKATHAHRAGKPGSSVLLLCSPQRLTLPTLLPCTSILPSVPASQNARESSLGSEGLDASQTFPAL